MKIVFATNYYNHHQAPFAEAMDLFTDHNFYFVETKPLSEERKALGWGEDGIPSFVLQAYTSKEEKDRCQNLINDADVVIWGGCPFSMVRPRLKKKKLTFAYSERIFKKGFSGFDYWGRVIKYFCRLKPYLKRHYLLCASSYAASDYDRIGLFKGKAFRWGYFPSIKKHEDLSAILGRKEENSILWVGRLIDWKHPEMAIEAARLLRDEGITFNLNIIGCGEMEDILHSMITEYNLEDRVKMLGSMSPQEVRRYMEASQIFLFTSDQNEGWGAVLNEAMNSCCTVVADNRIGSVPYLMKDTENGFIYYTGELEEMYKKVKLALAQKEKCKEIGRNAYQTMADMWNAEVAAWRLIEFIKRETECFEGPMSKDDGSCK